MDPRKGIYFLKPDGSFASVWDVWRHPYLLRSQPDDWRTSRPPAQRPNCTQRSAPDERGFRREALHINHVSIVHERREVASNDGYAGIAGKDAWGQITRRFLRRRQDLLQRIGLLPFTSGHQPDQAERQQAERCRFRNHYWWAIQQADVAEVHDGISAA